MATEKTVVIKQPKITFKTTTTEEHTASLIQQPKTEVIRIPGCPDGLECLLNLDTLLVDQSVELFNTMPSNYKKRNKFMIRDKNNTKLFCINEDENCMNMFSFGKMRELNINVQEMINDKSNILKFYSPRSGICCCCFINIGVKRILDIQTSKGQKLGQIHLIGYYFRPELNIKNESNEIIFTIKGPLFTGKCWVNNVFRIFHPSGTEVGKIVGKWAGCRQECLSDFDSYEITFPKNLEITSKALIMAACILIDYVFYHWNSVYLGVRDFVTED